MLSEWMKVMIDEIARKKAEADSARIEQQRRLDEQPTGPSSDPSSGREAGRHDADGR
jgi:hypothetical protein